MYQSYALVLVSLSLCLRCVLAHSDSPAGAPRCRWGLRAAPRSSARYTSTYDFRHWHCLPT